MTQPSIFSLDGDRISEAPWRDYRLLAAYAVGLCLTCAALAAFLNRRRLPGTHVLNSANTTMLLWVAFVAYAGWLVLFSIYRYAVPLEMLVPLLLCVMLVLLSGPRIGLLLTGLFCVGLVVSTQKADFARAD